MLITIFSTTNNNAIYAQSCASNSCYSSSVPIFRQRAEMRQKYGVFPRFREFRAWRQNVRSSRAYRASNRVIFRRGFVCR